MNINSTPPLSTGKIIRLYFLFFCSFFIPYFLLFSWGAILHINTTAFILCSIGIAMSAMAVALLLIHRKNRGFRSISTFAVHLVWEVLVLAAAIFIYAVGPVRYKLTGSSGEMYVTRSTAMQEHFICILLSLIAASLLLLVYSFASRRMPVIFLAICSLSLSILGISILYR